MAKVYVGGIDVRATEADLEDAFSKFGTLRSVWVARKPPGFAFVEFEDSRDADDAIRKLDGHQGWRVELSRTANRGGGGGGGRGGGRSSFGDRYGDRDRGMRSDMKCYNCGESGHFSRECTRASRDRYGDRDRDRGYRRSRSPRRSPRVSPRRSPRRSPSYSPPRARRSPSYGRSPSRSPKRSP